MLLHFILLKPLTLVGQLEQRQVNCLVMTELYLLYHFLTLPTFLPTFGPAPKILLTFQRIQEKRHVIVMPATFKSPASLECGYLLLKTCS